MCAIKIKHIYIYKVKSVARRAKRVKEAYMDRGVNFIAGALCVITLLFDATTNLKSV